MDHTNPMFKSAFSETSRYKVYPNGDSLTHQSMAEECDINKIMLKWQKTGVIEHRNTFDGQYGDFVDVPTDYHAAVNQVMEAQDMFNTLPSSVRKNFANDPGLFLEFVSDPKNGPKMVEMGLATSRENVLEKHQKSDGPKIPEKLAEKPEKIGEKSPPAQSSP